MPDEIDVPEGMWTKGKPAVPRFEPDELLYRRVPPDSKYYDFAIGECTIDAVELPDMSVNRGSLGPKEWLLLDYPHAGVASFRVDEIPHPILHNGIRWYSFFPVHRPEKKNWPHSQVEAYESDQRISRHEDGIHVDGKFIKIDDREHYRWRYQLRCKLKMEITPTGDDEYSIDA